MPLYPHKLRLRWYALVDRGEATVTEVCRRFDIPRKTYYKWRQRDFSADHRYRAPRPQPATKLTQELREFIEWTKRRTNYGPAKMHLAVLRQFRVSLSTTVIYRYYRRRTLIRRPQKRLPWYAPLKTPLRITWPGEGVQMDVKYVYEDGKRRYQFSVFDPWTELYHFTIAETRESQQAITAFQRAEQYFGFSIRSVQTDNGSECRGDFHRWLTARGTPHYFIPKKSPYWNGKVERVHRTVDDEYYHNELRPWKTVYEWLHYYNTERIHLTLGGLTPREKLAQTVTPRC